MSATSDLFASGSRGAFPSIDELEGKLVILKPQKIEHGVQGKFGLQDRATVDVVVFDDKGEVDQTIDDMYFSQKGIVGPCEKALKPGNKPMVLGRITKTPSKQTREMDPPLDTIEKVYAGIEKWRKDIAAGKKTVEPKFGWGLADFSEDDLAAATNYLNKNSPLASGAE